MTSSYKGFFLDFLLVLTNLHISLEAGTSSINLLRLKCVFLNPPILVLNIILYMLYISTLYILYILVNYVIV